jgi:hypothetical protein
VDKTLKRTRAFQRMLPRRNVGLPTLRGLSDRDEERDHLQIPRVTARVEKHQHEACLDGGELAVSRTDMFMTERTSPMLGNSMHCATDRHAVGSSPDELTAFVQFN